MLAEHSLLTRFFHFVSTNGDKQAYIFLDRHGNESHSLSYRQLYVQSLNLSKIISQHSQAGDNIGLVYFPGLHFIVGLLACWMSKTTAVPLAPISFKQSPVNMTDLLIDINSHLLLCDSSAQRQYFNSYDGVTLATDCINLNRDDSFKTPLQAEMVHSAIIQFTSGSTAKPKGVIIQHRNLAANLAMIQQSFEHDSASTFFGWTPHYHDQGLIANILQPLYIGATSILMSPKSFIRNPLLWLQAISRYRVQTSGGPNFAYDLCIARYRNGSLDNVDLSSWSAAFNGAEPIRADTIEKFTTTFAALGLKSQAFYPCYGLAESTLVSSGGIKNSRPVTKNISYFSLTRHGTIEPASNSQDKFVIVGCGKAMQACTIKIVDAESRTECKTNHVGEIWIAGEHVAKNYWRNKSATDITLNAAINTLAFERPKDSKRYLRTGDLGFLDESGELYFTGRMKEILVQQGRNYAPQDIEVTANNIAPSILLNKSVIFSILDKNSELIIFVQEIRRGDYDTTALSNISLQIRKHIAQTHDLTLHKVCLVKPGTIPMTTSGKKCRSKIREWYLADKLSSKLTPSINLINNET